MKRLMRPISAASGDDSKLLLAADSLKEDFEFVLSGLERLDRSGAEASNAGLVIAEHLQSAIQSAIAELGDAIA